MTEKLNNITKELTQNTGLSEEMLTTTEDIEQVVQSIRGLPEPEIIDGLEGEFDIAEVPAGLNASEMAATLVEIDKLQADFNFLRSALRESTENSRQMLKTVSSEILATLEPESLRSLLMVYAEINKAQTENIKLFMTVYKDLSTALVNFSKLQKAESPAKAYTTNVLNIQTESLSVPDVIARIRGEKSS